MFWKKLICKIFGHDVKWIDFLDRGIASPWDCLRCGEHNPGIIWPKPPPMPSIKHHEFKKRAWCYVQQPSRYDVAPCDCGNHETQWSEWKDHLWCDKCQKDFIPEHYGIFDGPIPAGVAQMLGISFDRINLETMEIIKFDLENPVYKNMS